MESTVSEGVEEAQSIHEVSSPKSKKKYIVIFVLIFLVVFVVGYLFLSSVGLNPLSKLDSSLELFDYEVEDTIVQDYVHTGKLIGVEVGAKGSMVRVSDDKKGGIFMILEENTPVYFVEDGKVVEKKRADDLTEVEKDSNVGYTTGSTIAFFKEMNILFKDEVYPNSSIYESGIVIAFYVY